MPSCLFLLGVEGFIPIDRCLLLCFTLEWLFWWPSYPYPCCDICHSFSREISQEVTTLNSSCCFSETLPYACKAVGEDEVEGHEEVSYWEDWKEAESCEREVFMIQNETRSFLTVRNRHFNIPLSLWLLLLQYWSSWCAYTHTPPSRDCLMGQVPALTPCQPPSTSQCLRFVFTLRGKPFCNRPSFWNKGEGLNRGIGWMIYCRFSVGTL